MNANEFLQNAFIEMVELLSAEYVDDFQINQLYNKLIKEASEKFTNKGIVQEVTELMDIVLLLYNKGTDEIDDDRAVRANLQDFNDEVMQKTIDKYGNTYAEFQEEVMDLDEGKLNEMTLDYYDLINEIAAPFIEEFKSGKITKEQAFAKAWEYLLDQAQDDSSKIGKLPMIDFKFIFTSVFDEIEIEAITPEEKKKFEQQSAKSRAKGMAHMERLKNEIKFHDKDNIKKHDIDDLRIALNNSGDVNDFLAQMESFFGSIKKANPTLIESIQSSYRSFGRNQQLFKLYLETITTNSNKHIVEAVEDAADIVNPDNIYGEKDTTGFMFSDPIRAARYIIHNQAYPFRTPGIIKFVETVAENKDIFDIDKIDVVALMGWWINHSTISVELLTKIMNICPELFPRAKVVEYINKFPDRLKNKLLEKALSGEI